MVNQDKSYITDVSNERLSQDKLDSVDLTEEYLSSADCTVIATNHSSYDLEQIVIWSKLVFDTRGATRQLKNTNIVRLGE